jgi:thioredoxin-like negative regulator of GroEL
MESLSNEMSIQFVDVDASPQLVAEYGVRNVPTIVVVNNGQVLSKQAGVLTESQVRNLWNQN